MTGRVVTKTRYASVKGKSRAAYKDAERKLQQLQEELTAEAEEEARAADHSNYTLGQAVIAWHKWAPTQPKVSQKTADKHLGQAGRWILPHEIASVPLAELDEAAVMEFLEDIAPDLGRDSLSRLKHVINWSIMYAMRQKKETGFSGPNVCASLGKWLPEAGHKPRKHDFLSMEQVEAILKATEDTPMHALFVTGFMMGLRPGELAALKWGSDSVDFRRGIIWVLKSRRDGGDGETKTKASRRSHTMPGRVKAALEKHQALFGDHEYVFTREDGRQLDKDAMSWRVGKALRAAGIEGISDPYVMRHTFASIAYNGGMTVKEISKMMGHKNEKVTATVYIHLFNPDTVDTGSAMDDIWGAAS